MDDEGGEGAPSCRFFKLIGPPAVIGHASAAEPACHGVVRQRFKIRIVHQKDSDLAGKVDIAKIIPVSLRRVGAVANKHDGRGININGIGCQNRADL